MRSQNVHAPENQRDPRHMRAGRTLPLFPFREICHANEPDGTRLHCLQHGITSKTKIYEPTRESVTKMIKHKQFTNKRRISRITLPKNTGESVTKMIQNKTVHHQKGSLGTHYQNRPRLLKEGKRGSVRLNKGTEPEPIKQAVLNHEKTRKPTIMICFEQARRPSHAPQE